MPTSGGAGAPVAPKISSLLLRREGGSLLRVDAHIEHLEILADAPPHVLGALYQSVEDQGAEHRALVIAQYQHNRFPGKILANPHLFSVFITEGQGSRDLCVELL